MLWKIGKQAKNNNLYKNSLTIKVAKMSDSLKELFAFFKNSINKKHTSLFHHVVHYNVTSKDNSYRKNLTNQNDSKKETD